MDPIELSIWAQELRLTNPLGIGGLQVSSRIDSFGWSDRRIDLRDIRDFFSERGIGSRESTEG